MNEIKNEVNNSNEFCSLDKPITESKNSFCNQINHDVGFGYALNCLKNGRKVARKGWNGKGMWVEMMKMFTHTPIKDGRPLEPFLVIKNVQGSYNTWVPSISDLLAEDWLLID